MAFGATSGARSRTDDPITQPRTTSSPRTPSTNRGAPAFDPSGNTTQRRADGRHNPAGSGRPRRPAGATGARSSFARSGGRRPNTPSVAAQVTPPAPRRDPRPAITTWAEAGLPDVLIRTLARRGMHEPFAIQSAALPDAMAGEHLLARARTGAGKTLGFGLPMITLLAADRVTPAPCRPRGLVLVPTRELATQVTDALAPLAQPMGLKMRTVVGGASIGRQIEQLKQRADIVIATPGRLTDLIERGACDLSDVRITVLDEADHMCDLGFLPVMKQLLAQVPADGQRMLFSATLDGEVDGLARTYLPDPVLVAIDPEVSHVDTMEHRPLEVRDTSAKLAVVTELAGGSLRTLVFTRTKHGADRLARQLSQAGVPARALHGGLAQNARTRALAAFSDGSARVLVATDVMARGIHVDGVELVVHADAPTEAKAYLHRSGRTARAGADGTVVVVALPDERRAVERLLVTAGVSARLTAVAPGDPVIADIAGPPAPRVAMTAYVAPEQVGERRAFGTSRPPRAGGARPSHSAAAHSTGSRTAAGFGERPARSEGGRPQRQPSRQRPFRSPGNPAHARPPVTPRPTRLTA